MQKEIRTFIALKVNVEEHVLHQLNYFKQVFKNDIIRWVNPDNFHLTLRFMGNTNRHQLDKLFDGLEIVAGNNKPFRFKINGAGYFGRKGKPQVLFVKIDKSAPLTHLAEEIEKTVVSCKFKEELKPFRPHLTLGRIKYLESRTRFCNIVEAIKEKEYQTVDVAEFILYESILRPDGPIYKPIKTFQLK